MARMAASKEAHTKKMGSNKNKMTIMSGWGIINK
jgi:hypothetical protein